MAIRCTGLAPALARGMRIVVIAKPPRDARATDELELGLDRLREEGHVVRSRLTTARGDGELFARGAVRGGADLVLAVGGDGTVNEIVNGLAPAEVRPRLGILPTGTANDFARSMGLPRALDEALEVALRGRPVALDVARVNRRWFINVSLGGFGVAAASPGPRLLKKRLGPFAYFLSGLRRLRQFRPEEAVFECAGQVLHEGQYALFAVGNSWRTGGGVRVTPRALPTDGRLDVMIVRAVGRLELLALLPALRAGTHLASSSVLYVRTPSLVVRSQAQLHVHADGESVRGNPLVYSVAERCLEVMLPG